MTELGQVPPVGTLRHRPPMGTTCRLPPFFPRIIEFRTILSLLPDPPLSKHPCPTFPPDTFSRESPMLVEGQFVLFPVGTVAFDRTIS